MGMFRVEISGAWGHAPQRGSMMINFFFMNNVKKSITYLMLIGLGKLSIEYDQLDYLIENAREVKNL